MTDRQLAGLSEASLRKKQSARAKTDKAIAKLVANKEKITFRSVAREARVSISYLYKYPEISYEINKLKEQQKYSSIAPREAAESDKTSANVLLDKNKILADKIVELEAIIEKITPTKNTLKNLREENIQLATENVRLKKELEYALESLQSAREFIVEKGRNDLNLPEG